MNDSVDVSDVGVGVVLDAELGAKLHQRLRHGTRAAHGIPDALLRLHVTDRAQDCGRSIGRGPDILNEVVQHLRRIAVGDEFTDEAAHRFAQPHLHHVFKNVDIEHAT